MGVRTQNHSAKGEKFKVLKIKCICGFGGSIPHSLGSIKRKMKCENKGKIKLWRLGLNLGTKPYESNKVDEKM